MACVIAVAGKGGTGKTTICGLLVKYLARKGLVLAVDADANSNLNEVLGVEEPQTLGVIREEIAHSGENTPTMPGGMTKKQYMDFLFEDALTEEDGFDLLVMGRTQGKGCYCFVNGLLQTQIQKYLPAYPYIVVDNEAGLEHISRGLLPAVDILLLVSDCSRRGIQAVGRIAALAKEVGLHPKKTVLIVNKAPETILAPGIQEEIALQGLSLAGVFPYDATVYSYDCDGKPTAMLPVDSALSTAFTQTMNVVLQDMC